MILAALEKMLLFNSDSRCMDPTKSSDYQEIMWKVLILDVNTTNIVSSVLRVNDLLQLGVTVHSSIKQERPPLPDVPVIYFVQPTQENVDLIVEDLKNDMYAEYYINFSSSFDRELLEDFARKVSTLAVSPLIKQVFDQYLDFLVTEPELFSLDLKETYSLINNPQSNEDAIIKTCENIANGLYNVILTLDTVPVIRALRGGPAEMVAQKLESKLRDYVINTRTNNSHNSLERFVLVILDRNIDLPTMLAHSWIYQCLVFDVFNLSRNTITVPSKDSQGIVSSKRMDIEPKDFFWSSNAHLPFPDAVENVEAALAEYKAEAEDITRKTGVNDIDDLDPNFHKDTLQIQEAVNRLPELTAKKNIIDTHMNVLAALLKELENKGLDSFFEIEQMTDPVKLKQAFLQLLKDGRKNNLEDKLRTFVIMFLTASETLPKDFIVQVEEYFTNQDFDISALKYVYKLREIMKLSKLPINSENGVNIQNTITMAGSSSQLLSGLSNRFLGLAEGKIQGGVGSLISGIKNFLPEKKATPVTTVLASIMDPLNNSQGNLEITDDYLYFDPRVMRGSHSQKPKRQSYNKSLVFIVGGGNYVEYQNLQEWAQKQNTLKKVIYGSTSITTPRDFLKELAKITK